MTSSSPTPAAVEDATKEASKVPPGKTAYWVSSLSIFIAAFIVDHLTKWWAQGALMPSAATMYPPRIEIIPHCLDLMYAENKGAAFSMFDGKVGILAYVSLFASIGFAWFWWSLPATERWGRWAVALVLSGAIGNMIDRFWRGYVVDFIHAYFRDHHWPTFNIADSAICVGAVIIAVRILQKKI